MKTLRITRDIPGYKKGEVISDNQPIPIHMFESFADYLIKEGFAEYIPDEVDMAEIKRNAMPEHISGISNPYSFVFKMDIDDMKWFTAYRIVKSIIDQLNEGWEPDWNNDKEHKYYVYYDHEEDVFDINSAWSSQYCYLPICKDREAAEKVIELCEPELKVLFGVK